MAARPTVRYLRGMRPLLARLVLLTSLVFVALAVSPSGSPTLVLAGIAAALVAAALAVRAAAVVAGARRLTVGARSRQHGNGLIETPEPKHPATAGRPRTRAPSARPLAA